MPVFTALVQVMGYLSIYAVVCLAVYSALRVFQTRLRVASLCLGVLASVGWCLLFAGVVVLAGVRWDDDASPYPYVQVGELGAALLLTMWGGGTLWKTAT